MSEVSEQVKAIKKTERAIQLMLIELQNEHDINIESVEVDCRVYANFRVSIFFEIPKSYR